MNRVPLFLVFVCGALPAPAQKLPPWERQFFGEEIVEYSPMPAAGAPRALRLPKPPPPEGLQHGLILQGGQVFRGELVAMSATEIVWRRPDVNVPLRFPRAQVRRVILRESETAVRSAAMPPEPMMQRRKVPEVKPPVPALVQFAGAEWLRGDLRSWDGKAFYLENPEGLSLGFSRDAVESIWFGSAATPRATLSGEAPWADGWVTNEPTVPPELEEGRWVIKRGWVGCNFASADGSLERFEVEFAMPQQLQPAGDPCQLWLRAANWPSSYGYYPGTMAVTFGATKLSQQYSVGAITKHSTDVPNETRTPDGLTRYRVFYDGIAERLTIWRNGEPISEWDFGLKVKDATGRLVRKPPPIADIFELRPHTLCLQPEAAGPLKLHTLQVKPWDGILPGRNAQDSLATKQPEVKTGTLQAVTQEEIIFSGRGAPRTFGTFLRLAPPAARAIAPRAVAQDTILIFGRDGRIAAAGLEIAEGRIKGRTNFSPAMEAPLSMLQRIEFPPATVKSDAGPDLLVFHDGETLPGTLLAAADGKPVHWRTGAGQEVTFESARIAGVRLGKSASATPAGVAAVEMRNGDRFCGALEKLDGEKLRLQHGTLGALALDRRQVWSISPRPMLTLPTAGADILRSTRHPGFGEHDGQMQRVELDGRFVEFNERVFSPRNEVAHVFQEPPPRYELRADYTDVGVHAPQLRVWLSSKTKGGPSTEIALGGARVEFLAIGPSIQKDGKWIDGPKKKSGVPLRTKLSESTTRHSLRLFVDPMVGTVDVFLNGAAFGRATAPNDVRMEGVGEQFSLSAPPPREGAVFGNLALLPWSGELPVTGEQSNRICFTNGDTISGPPMLSEGKISAMTDIGEITTLLERVASVQFGGEPAPTKAAGRLRLRDGSIVHVEAFRLETGKLRTRSLALGDIEIPAVSIAEIILSPAPVIFPKTVEARPPSSAP